MKWTTLATEVEYEEALTRCLAIFHADDGTKEADEFVVLLHLIKDYEEMHIQLQR